MIKLFLINILSDFVQKWRELAAFYFRATDNAPFFSIFSPPNGEFMP